MLIVLLKGTDVNIDSTSNEANRQPWSNNSFGISLILFAAINESLTAYWFSVKGFRRFDRNFEIP